MGGEVPPLSLSSCLPVSLSVANVIGSMDSPGLDLCAIRSTAIVKNL